MYASYQLFQRLKELGCRQEATAAAQQVVVDYHNDPKPEFVAAICADVNHKLNHTLWSGIVLPYVLAELKCNPVAVKCLIQTIQNLYSDKSAHAKLNWISEQQLLDCYLRMCPDNAWAVERKRSCLVRWLEYTIHEWPAGILYGHDGATIEQCEEILDAVNELRAIDRDMKYASLCSDVEEKTIQWRDRRRGGDGLQ